MYCSCYILVFRFVQLNSPNTDNIQKKFKVPLDIETLLLFNENVNRSVASLSMACIPIKTMKDVINSNMYLVLPRLSSQVRHCSRISSLPVKAVSCNDIKTLNNSVYPSYHLLMMGLEKVSEL